MATTTPVRLIDVPPHRPPALGEWVRAGAIALQHRLQALLAPFATPIYQPTVIQRRDRHGNAYWELYDPNTQRTLFCMSEAEVNVWLETRWG